MNNEYYMVSEYHKEIFSRYGLIKGRDINFDVSLKVSENIKLRGTEQLAKSKVGLLIDTGMTVPRESFYTIFAQFPDINVLAYDKRGHGDSEGEFGNAGCISDNLCIARKWKEDLDLDVLIGFGHSYGGMVMTYVAADSLPPYDEIIIAGAPVELRKVGGLLPKVFSRTSVYFYNLARLSKRPSRDRIAHHHRAFNPWKFGRDPRIVALRVGDVDSFNESMAKMSRLTDLVAQLNVPASYFYGGNDGRLKISGKFKKDYTDLEERCKMVGAGMTVLPGLSHRFNRQPETDFAFSYNNGIVFGEMRRIIGRYL